MKALWFFAWLVMVAVGLVAVYAFVTGGIPL